MMMQDLPSCFMLANIHQFATSLLPFLFRGVFDAVSNVSLFKVFKDMDHATKIGCIHTPRSLL
ncbi:hypothetical protein, partial [Salmonella sp. gx-f7]|uniref:hypothetical protein n=1 Tax=Salmonella sp. gx-f7 TaxID=2582606 RepID=UPI001F45569D